MLETRKECREGGVVFYLQEAKRQEDGGAPLTVCLTDGQAEALMALELLDRGQNPGGAIAAAVVPDLLPDEQEQALADFVFALQSYPGVCPTRISLTGSVACADLVWRLASHFPAWFSAVCAVGGKGNPYEVRALTSTPLRAYIFPGEERADGGLPAAGERLVAALRIAGSDSASCVRIDPPVRASMLGSGFLKTAPFSPGCRSRIKSGSSRLASSSRACGAWRTIFLPAAIWSKDATALYLSIRGWARGTCWGLSVR